MFNTAINVIIHHQCLEGALLERWRCERRSG